MQPQEFAANQVVDSGLVGGAESRIDRVEHPEVPALVLPLGVSVSI